MQMKIIKFCLLLFCLTLLISCTQVNTTNSLIGDRTGNQIKSTSVDVTNSNLTETATPQIIKQLNQPTMRLAIAKIQNLFNEYKI